MGVSEHVAGRLALPRLHVIRNAVTDPGAPNTAWTEDRPAVRFAYVGRLVTEKGVRILLEAAALLVRQGLTPSISIIGDGPERAALERQKTELKLGDHVTFLGFMHGLALEGQIRQTSVLVMPSLCEDVAPLSALEMMMQGRLIICSKVGGLAEQVGEAGLMFAPGDAQGLAHRMRDVLENPSVITTLGQQARERAISKYNLQGMVAEYRSLLSASRK